MPDTPPRDASQPPPPWWREAVIYQVYPRSFADGDGDGNGDLAGLRARLDYITSLGVQAIWLSPIYASPLRDNGYDVTDHCAVHPMFGTLAEVDRLIADLRARDIRVILDFVANHTSDQHPWFVASRRGRDADKRDWYLWADAAPDGGPPNNWLSLFGGPAWTYDPASGQYYCHSFLACQPDLDWNRGEVRNAMLDILSFWLARGVAGFRVDATGLIAKDATLSDDPLNPHWRPGDPPADRILRTHSGNGPQLLAHLRAMRDRLRTVAGDPVLLGETYGPPSALAPFYGPCGDGLHLAMNMELVTAAWTAPALATIIASAASDLPPNAWPHWVLGNHDVSRVATRLGEAQARVAMLLLLTLRGTPILYAGDELGLTDGRLDGAGHDPIATEDQRGRDPQRAPLPWDTTPHAGFSSVAPWLPIDAANAARNVARQDGDPTSMLELTRALLRLRRREPALSRGDLIALDQDEHVLSFTRTFAGRALRILLNLSDEPRSVRVHGKLLLSTVERALPASVEGPAVLMPNEAMILALAKQRE